MNGDLIRKVLGSRRRRPSLRAHFELPDLAHSVALCRGHVRFTFTTDSSASTRMTRSGPVAIPPSSGADQRVDATRRPIVVISSDPLNGFCRNAATLSFDTGGIV